MKTATKIFFASALALSTAAPTFVHAAYLQNASQIRATGAPAQHVMDKSARAIRGLELHGICAGRRRRQVLPRLRNRQPALGVHEP